MSVPDVDALGDSQTIQTTAPNADQGPSMLGYDAKTIVYALVAGLVAMGLLERIIFPLLCRIVGGILGWYLRRKSSGRRKFLLTLMQEDEERFEKRQGLGPQDPDDVEWEVLRSQTPDFPDKNWRGIVGFLHPFCNAGGGGERVLWAAIRATQLRYPKALCVVYTGDHGIGKSTMLMKVKNRFDIHLHAPGIHFVYLTSRSWVLASTWPRFTLLGQSIGSVIMAWDALQLLTPDIFIDTMGYAFAQGFARFLFPRMPTCAYVHYPTISTDMLESLDPSSPLGSRGVNAGQGAGMRGVVKMGYWKMFAAVYSRVGATIDVVLTNSSWTQAHIQNLWGRHRAQRKMPHAIDVVYPPVPVTALERSIKLTPESEKGREKYLLFLAQFRPEKDHQTVIQAFAQFAKSGSPASEGAKLVLVGSVRDDGDSKRVYQLRLLVNELNVRDRVIFHLDASWPEVLEWLSKAYVGVNGMWNEHFGIGVVEYQAAGLIPVVHGSGGPKMDIVVDVDGEPTGFHATNVDEFAQGFEAALSLPNPLAMRQRARQSSRRFTEEVFAGKWTSHMETLVAMKQ